MKKVAIIGAGNVGGTTALRIAESGIASVVLMDVAENLARAKASDLEDARYSLKRDTRIEGTSEISRIDGSDVVVITAGLARKPGMTREDLLIKNAEIVGGVCRGVAEFAKDAIVIIVSNPLDVMTYLAFKKTGFSRQKVFGMGSSLDASRFANLISKKLFVGIENIQACVVGSHGETMLPLPRLSKVRGKPLTELIEKQQVDELVTRTRGRGAEIVSLYGSGSAYMAPSAAIFELVETILTGHAKEIAVSVCLDGEYGLYDVAIGLPAMIGSGGIEKVYEVDFTTEEKDSFLQSAKSISNSIKSLNL